MTIQISADRLRLHKHPSRGSKRKINSTSGTLIQLRCHSRLNKRTNCPACGTVTHCLPSFQVSRHSVIKWVPSQFIWTLICWPFSHTSSQFTKVSELYIKPVYTRKTADGLNENSLWQRITDNEFMVLNWRVLCCRREKVVCFNVS